MTSPEPLTEEDRVLAAEYALRLLPDAEEQAFEARMLDDRRLEAFVAQTVVQFAPLSDDVAAVPPARGVKSQLMGDLFGAPSAPTSIWERVSLWRMASFGTTAAAALMAVMLVFQPNPVPIAPVAPATPERGALFVSEIANDDNSLRVLAVYDAASGDLQLTRTAGAAAPDRALELWAIAGDAAPVSLGVLPPTDKAGVTLPDALRGNVAGLVLAISDEPPGGSPTGAPTGAVLAVGGVVDI